MASYSTYTLMWLSVRQWWSRRQVRMWCSRTFAMQWRWELNTPSRSYTPSSSWHESRRSPNVPRSRSSQPQRKWWNMFDSKTSDEIVFHSPRVMKLISIRTLFKCQDCFLKSNSCELDKGRYYSVMCLPVVLGTLIKQWKNRTYIVLYTSKDFSSLFSSQIRFWEDLCSFHWL